MVLRSIKSAETNAGPRRALAGPRASHEEIELATAGVEVASSFPGGGLKSLSGTSMATPHVAGVAVRLAQKLKDEDAFSIDSLKARLTAGATSDQGAPDLGIDDVRMELVEAP